MMRSFYQGISGMKAMADGLAVTGNNLANAKTTGYKARQAMFEDLYYQQYRAATSPTDEYSGINPIEQGNGVKMKGLSLDLSQGTLTSTGKNTDLAISGEGYFVAGNADGNEKLYTRDGSFELSSDSKLVTSGGQYVLGWNVDQITGKINTSAGVSPLEININQVSKPVESKNASVKGNLNATSEVGNVVGMQIPTYDSLGARHDVDLNIIKTGTAPAEYTYIASPANDFIKSASIEKAVLQPSSEIASKIQKGNYTFSTSPGATTGTVDITVKDPSGTTIISKTVTDNDQTISLDDGTNQWFTVNYKGGGAPSTANFQIAEVGKLGYDSNGQMVSKTGSGTNGNAKLDFIPQTTGKAMSVNVDLSYITGVAADDSVTVKDSDGFPSATLKSYTIGDGGIITGYFSDGSIKDIGQVAVATFANPSGLSAQGENYFSVTANSGEASIGVSGLGDKGTIKAGSLESSNVDTATELTELMFYQKAYTANSKNISVSSQVLDVAINLIR
ncbi:flagellar hook protein FlgE [Bacillus mexicanus]|uniref:flagellar hook protein FlgE n=1 Tax=Bacillus mexicanus TaxID=2834415 RepID=UPI003D1957C6